jgi:hypothetical protein
MRRRNDGSDINSTVERGWAELARERRIDSMSRVLAYLFRYEGAEHDEPRAKEPTAKDWILEEQIRPEAPGILAKLIGAGPETMKRNPSIVPQDAHGLAAQYIGAWLWGGAIDRMKAGF